MSLQKILAISGKPGLFELKVQTRTGFVAENLLDGKKITVGLRNNVSLLSEIAVYTYDEEIKLAQVFKFIAEKENEGPTISHKEDASVMLNYFREVLPDFDEDRVYLSDIKKILNWYNLLHSKGFVSLKSLSESDEEETGKEENQ
ncbi:MAG: DUF5606 domain-containing protein [Flavobacteriaceae bacterium]|jgi:hypothetical protein|nr:DUF5606 domain-containing protein [Flavobacteriaceae bacterium]